MRYLIWLLKAMLIIICGISLLRMPCLCYVFFRYVSFTLFLLFCAEAFKRKHTYLGIVWVVSALIRNPFVKPALERALWNTFDVIWIVIVLGSLVADFKRIYRGDWR